VQQRLHSAGAYNGAVDGVWGPDSAAALQQYQSSHQLQVTGQLNQATAASLGVDLGALLGTQQAASMESRIIGGTGRGRRQANPGNLPGLVKDVPGFLQVILNFRHHTSIPSRRSSIIRLVRSL